MTRYLKVGDSCKVCSTPRVDISHQTLLEILELSPSIKSIPQSVLAKGKDFYAICPCCDAYALGIELTTGFPFTEADGNITNIQELTSRSDLAW